MTRSNSTLLLSSILLLASACGDDPAGDSDSDETGTSAETSGDGDGDGDGDASVLKIDGGYTDEWMSAHTITDANWAHGSDNYAISQFDNELEFVIAQNGASNAFAPDMWSRFDFAFVGNSLYYCQTAFDVASEADALAAARSDDADPSTGGCGGMFAWTKLGDDQLEIGGSYVDEWMSAHTVNSTTWMSGDSIFTLSQFDASEDLVVAQNAATNEFSPDLWSRFDYVYVGNELFYCQSAFDAADEAAALATARPDDSDPASTGCGGMFAWTKLQ